MTREEKDIWSEIAALKSELAALKVQKETLVSVRQELEEVSKQQLNTYNATRGVIDRLYDKTVTSGDE